MEENFDDLDEFEAMEAEAEAVAKDITNKPQSKTSQPVRAIVKPGEPNPNVIQTKGRPEVMPRPQPSQPQPQSRRQQQPQSPPQPEQASPLWVAYFQPEVIGIMNTQTGEKMEGFKDEGTAQAEARILNELNTIIIAGGFE